MTFTSINQEETMFRTRMVTSMTAILLVFTISLLTGSVARAEPVAGGDSLHTQPNGIASVPVSMVSDVKNESFKEMVSDFRSLLHNRTELAPMGPGAIACDDAIYECSYLPIIMTPLPSDFDKVSPNNGATGQSTSLSLDWADSSGATSYEYCYDTAVSGTCTGSWTSTGSTSQAGPLSLANSTTYRWQVRANNAAGTTYADSGTVWTFTTDAWTIVTSENFEGTFPQTGWSRIDRSTLDEGVNIIGKSDCKSYGGDYGGWMVGVRDGADRICGVSYPNLADTWFIYGPFSTVGATDGLLTFIYYTCMTDTDDRLYVRITDNYSATTWQGFSFTGCGTTSFKSDYLDLSVPRCLGGTASCLNLPSVYVAFQFVSDSATTNQYGAVLDNIVLKLCMSGSCPTSSPVYGDGLPQSDAIQDFLAPFALNRIEFGSITLEE